MVDDARGCNVVSPVSFYVFSPSHPPSFGNHRTHFGSFRTVLKCYLYGGIPGMRCNRGRVLLAKQLIEQAGTGIEKLFDQALAGHGRWGM